MRVAVLAAPPRSGPGVTGAGAWSVVVGARDRQGLLATVSGALDDCGYDVRRAVVATWLDGAAVEEFEVRGPILPTAVDLEAAIAAAFGEPLESDRSAAAPTSISTTRAHHGTRSARSKRLTSPGSFISWPRRSRHAGVTVVAASIAERDTGAVDTFELVTRDGEKLEDREERAVREIHQLGARC